MASCAHTAQSEAASQMDLPSAALSTRLVLRNTLVLDIDNTLVYSSPTKLPRHDIILRFPQRNNMVDTIYVVKRPGLDGFLHAMADAFELVVFSAGSKCYVDALLAALDPTSALISRAFCRDSCVVDGEDKAPLKDLMTVGRDLSQVLMLDDDARSYSRQPENGIHVSSFEGLPEDKQLIELQPLLLRASKSNNVIEWLKENKDDLVKLKTSSTTLRRFRLGHAGRGPRSY